MTDLSEMVAWLRGVVSSDLEKARAAQSEDGYAEWDNPSTGVVQLAKGMDGLIVTPRDIAIHIAIHDPRDTIARCEQELAIIGRCHRMMNEMDEIPNGLISPRGVLARQTLFDLAHGYRNRPGWKEEWKP